jgi:hypothetical protein
MIISGSPGVGKTYLMQRQAEFGITISDSDSSTFDKKNFPQNYIEHIRATKGLRLVSSHQSVRQALRDAQLPFITVFPDVSLKKEYLRRYAERGSPDAFIDLVRENWENWIEGLEQDFGSGVKLLTPEASLYTALPTILTYFDGETC